MDVVARLALWAIVAGAVVGMALTVAHRDGGDPVTAESMRAIELAAREGRDWHADDGQPWAVRHPKESGAAVMLGVFVLGLLVVIAANSERPAPAPDPDAWA